MKRQGFTDAQQRYFAAIEAAIAQETNPQFKENLREALASERQSALTDKRWKAPRTTDLHGIGLDGKKL
jgi:hypothetical protein